MELIFASNNPGKAREFRRLIKNHSLMLPRDIGIEFSHDEKGKDFLDNAYGKAKELFSRTRKPVIADDSGLCVEALGGRPGVNSARYGAESYRERLTSEERNRLLLSELEGIDNRRAFFVCCVVLIVDVYCFFIAQETVCGEISHSPIGMNGFGYDPVFFLPSLGKTVAELDDREKDTISHRGKAIRKILQILE